MIIERNKYLSRLLDSKLNGLVKIVTGIRRSGKSFLLFNIFKQRLLNEGVDAGHIIEMQFDDFANKRYRVPEVFYNYVKERIKDGRVYYIILDEVQLLGDFEDVLNGLMHIENVDIYVTGSNARFLSKDIVTEFRGRGLQIHISPLSFAELMTFYNGSKEDALEHYLRYGGLPQVALQPNDEYRSTVLKDLLKETYIIDILERNRVKNSAELEELLAMLASGIGGLTNPQKLSNTFKTVKNVSIGAPTLKSYIDYFCDAFLVEQVNRYDVKGKRYIGTPLKYYFSDLGLRNALLNFRQVEKTHLIENLIYNELRGRGYNVDVGVVPYNGKNAQGVSFRTQLEVDFVCNKGSQRLYVQSALALPTQEKIDQETKSLRRIDDGFQKMVVVGDHTIGSHDESGILFINIYDFLMQ
ncbi:MAG: ATP-binding protein [Bacteroidales bacterium]|nr:ATP-binding protein [Bacteroidales bacterium]